jgi:hypothetical protein
LKGSKKKIAAEIQASDNVEWMNSDISTLVGRWIVINDSGLFDGGVE